MKTYVFYIFKCLVINKRHLEVKTVAYTAKVIVFRKRCKTEMLLLQSPQELTWLIILTTLNYLRDHSPTAGPFSFAAVDKISTLTEIVARSLCDSLASCVDKLYN